MKGPASGTQGGLPVCQWLNSRIVRLLIWPWGGLPTWFSCRESACQCRSHRRCGFDLWVRMISLQVYDPHHLTRGPLYLFLLLEKEMATHSSTLAWRIPWTDEPGGLQSRGWKETGTIWQLSSYNKQHDPEGILQALWITGKILPSLHWPHPTGSPS